jgi:uncharacterized protein (TIGR02001 family)
MKISPLNKLLASVTFAAAGFAPLAVQAQTAAPAAAPAPAPSPFTGNAGLYTDYRFRGYTQTGYKPAFQGGFDYAHDSGFYVGNWNSNVKDALYTGASLEMDFYGGFKGTAGPLGYDVGAIYYYYPGSGSNSLVKIDNTEIYGGISYGPVSAKLYYAVSDYFQAGKAVGGESTKGTTYIDLAGNFDIGSGFTLNTHVGFLSLKKNDQFVDVDGNVLSKNVADYKIGITKDISGWSVAGAIVGTGKKGYFGSGFADSSTVTGAEAGGKVGVVLSLSKTF